MEFIKFCEKKSLDVSERSDSLLFGDRFFECTIFDMFNTYLIERHLIE